jgi:hypothetical protein
LATPMTTRGQNVRSTTITDFLLLRGMRTAHAAPQCRRRVRLRRQRRPVARAHVQRRRRGHLGPYTRRLRSGPRRDPRGGRGRAAAHHPVNAQCLVAGRTGALAGSAAGICSSVIALETRRCS